MNTIKKLRQASGYTQEDLVEKSGLSLRTIQRLEASRQPPKGHSLKVLAEAFDLEPLELLKGFAPETHNVDDDKYSVKLINLSVLAFFLFPFGNIFLPFYLWRKHRASRLVDEMGKRIVNFQIVWSVLMAGSLIVAPFANSFFLSSHPLILYVLFIWLGLNLAVVVVTARSIQREEMDFPRPPVVLL